MNTYNQVDRPGFRLTQAWTVVGLYIAVSLAVSIPAALLNIVAKGLLTNNPQLNAWIIVATTAISYVFLFYIINQIFGRSTISKSLFEDKRIDWTVYILILLATLSLAIVLEPLSILLLKLLPMPDWFKASLEKMFTPTASTFVLAVIIAPLCEEVLMRGVILRGLLKSISPQKAIIWTSFFFALIHLNPWQALPAFVIGLFLGWLYWKTRSIWTCIFVHFVNNLFAFVGLAITESNGLGIETTLKDLTGGYFTSLFVVAAVLLIVSMSLLLKRYQLKKGNMP